MNKRDIQYTIGGSIGAIGGSIIIATGFENLLIALILAVIGGVIIWFVPKKKE